MSTHIKSQKYESIEKLEDAKETHFDVLQNALHILKHFFICWTVMPISVIVSL